MTSLAAPAKINLSLVVGPLREDGKHEVATVLQSLDLHDRIALSRSPGLTVTGYDDDTIVKAALQALAAAAGVEPDWAVEITKGIPVAAGLGGGSSDAAAALRLANRLLADPLTPVQLGELGATIGADVPFFLRGGTQLGTGDGAVLRKLELPYDYWVVLVLPAGVRKASTADVYGLFDARSGADGFHARRAALLEALAEVSEVRDLARLPPNDLAASPLSERLLELGAFRADVSGAGPCLYGLFTRRADADAAARALTGIGTTWVTTPA